MGTKRIDDLTVLFYTANVTSSHFFDMVTHTLKKAINNDFPIISVSHKPVNLGTNIVVGDIGRSNYNIYKQVLIGAKAATTTYVACAEDDVLYTPGHFRAYRPDDDTFGYDDNRWSIYTWYRPAIYSKKHRAVMNQLVAPRQLLIDSLEERFAKWPDPATAPMHRFAEPGRAIHEKQLGVKSAKIEFFASQEPQIMFSHEEALGWIEYGKRKGHEQYRLEELYPWGRADEVLLRYYGKPLC